MYIKPYIDYLIQFHYYRDYFECHEILEEYWKEDDSTTRNMWVPLIQYAVGLYHYRTSNFKGAEKMLTSSLKKLQLFYKEYEALGIDTKDWKQQLIHLINQIKHNQPYASVNIPLHKEIILHLQKELGTNEWTKESNLQNTPLIYRHTLRDRRAVIEERNAALQKSKLK